MRRLEHPLPLLIQHCDPDPAGAKVKPKPAAPLKGDRRDLEQQRQGETGRRLVAGPSRQGEQRTERAAMPVSPSRAKVRSTIDGGLIGSACHRSAANSLQALAKAVFQHA